MIDLVPNLIAGFGLLAAAVGAGGVALVAAKQMGLDTRLFRHLQPVPRSPERTLDLMVYCADIASQEGLLRLESQISACGEPLLIRGVSMALEGCSEADIRAELDRTIELTALRGAGRGRRMFAASNGLQLLGIFTAIGLLLFCLGSATGQQSGISPLLVLFGGFTGLLALVFGAVASDSAGLLRASDTLCDLIIAEGVLLLRAGRDSQDVAQRLSRLLPPADEPVMLAKAA